MSTFDSLSPENRAPGSLNYLVSETTLLRMMSLWVYRLIDVSVGIHRERMECPAAKAVIVLEEWELVNHQRPSIHQC